MGVFLIIGYILAYLLIGIILTGIFLKILRQNFEPELFILIILWPVFSFMGLVYGLYKTFMIFILWIMKNIFRVEIEQQIEQGESQQQIKQEGQEEISQIEQNVSVEAIADEIIFDRFELLDIKNKDGKNSVCAE